MEKTQKNSFIAIVAICSVALLVMVGVGFAAFQAGLNIKGSATVKSSSWKIKFQNLGAVKLTGTAKEVSAPVISNSDTYIGDFSVNFTTPGDTITYTFEVNNAGTFPASISSIQVGTPVCTGTGTKATTDAANVCKYLTYTLTYADGSSVKVGDTLAVGGKKSLSLKLAYGTGVTSSELPSNDVSITGLDVSILYAQD